MNGYKLKLEFEENERPYMLDITSLFYDLELLHDLSVLSAEEEYYDFRFTHNFWYRKGRPLKNYHRLTAARITKESPLVLEVVIPSLCAIWVLLQLIEKIQNWELNREKLELEVKKLRREEEEHKQKVMDLYADQLDSYLWERGAKEFQDRIINRLSQNPISLRDLEIERDEPKKGSEEGQTNHDEPSQF